MFVLDRFGLFPTPVTMNTSDVMVSTIITPGRFTLLIPVPRNVLSSAGANVISCGGESYRINELGKYRVMYVLVQLVYA